MIKWKEEKVFDQNIEKVWSLFADKNIQKIMPKVEEHRLIEKQENEIGAKHLQTYKEGKRMETYEVETLAYEDTEEKKHKQITFVIGKAFQVNLQFTLLKLSDNQTRFIYGGFNEGINFVGRAMLKMGSAKSNMKVVNEFMERVEAEALKL